MTKAIFPLALLGLIAAPPAAWAQSASDGSRAVVQPLPSPAVGDLNGALRRIARNPRDLDALLSAGSASMRLGDTEAAIGFFTRAREVQPNNAQAAQGLAGAYLRSDRPVEAIQLFREAEQAGASSQAMAADRGLAFDLVGDNAAAQQEYSRALTGAGADEVRRRMALSQAIQGNREAFERTLYPLLEKQDFAAYRIRAFALAILGQEKEAIAITEAVMPADLAARIAPYLNYMRRLTPAQQAAAANLGNFPRAAQIGRDDPRVLAYRESSGGIRTADVALAPAGQALGAAPVAAAPAVRSAGASAQERSEQSGQRRRPGRSSARAEAVPVAPPQRPVEVARAEPASPPAAQAATVQPVRQELPPVQAAAAQPAPVVQPVPVAQAPSAQAVAQPAIQQPVVQQAMVQEAVVQPVSKPAEQAAQAIAQPVVPAAAPAITSPAQAAAQPGFDLAQVSPAAPVQTAVPASTAVPAPTPLLPAAQPQTFATEPAPARVADAFADFAAAPRTSVTPAANAVDITRIKPPREVEAKPEEAPAPSAAKPAAKPAAKAAAAKPPAPPPHPSRHWVQLATGKDKAALRFDWRRFSGKAADQLGKLDPHVAAWGQTNRLLAGPYDTPRAANSALAAMKKAGLDGFVFTSEAGQEVERLK